MRSDPRPHAAFVKPNLHWVRRERKRGEKPAMPVPNPRLVARPGTRRARIAGTPCVFRARRRNQPTHVRSQERRTSCTPLRYERLEWLAGGASSARGRHRARCRDSCSRRSSVARRRRDTHLPSQSGTTYDDYSVCQTIGLPRNEASRVAASWPRPGDHPTRRRCLRNVPENTAATSALPATPTASWRLLCA